MWKFPYPKLNGYLGKSRKLFRPGNSKLQVMTLEDTPFLPIYFLLFRVPTLPGKCLEFAQKVVKTWNFNLKPGKM